METFINKTFESISLINKQNIRIIFILPNICECVNGVSTKYIKFINYLSNLSYNIILFTTFKNKGSIQLDSGDKSRRSSLIKKDNLNIINIKGLNIPFYKDIKIPIIIEKELKSEIKDGNEIIIFNGEFIWLYETLKNFKNKHKNIKLYPTMHTDYLYYTESYFSTGYSFKANFTSQFTSSALNYLNNNLDTKIFNGIIVTGEKMKAKYSEYSVFNANEVNLDIFNNVVKNTYNNVQKEKSHSLESNNKEYYNIIYCGRVAQEKNIDEILDCCIELKKNKIEFVLNIIGDGPYLDNLTGIINIKYKKIKSCIIFHGSKEPEEINNLYQSLDNRIFLFTSISETFGKTPMEAGATGIPIFIKKSDITDNLYINKKNAFIFDNAVEFIELFIYFLNLDINEKHIFISESVNNIKKYDQNIIFSEWIEYLINGKVNKNKTKINIFDMFTFHGISKFINCSGSILSD